MIRRLVLLGALLAGLNGARAEQCVLDKCLKDGGAATSDAAQGLRRNGAGPRGPSVPGRFDFYVLSLSWSPGFCETGGDEKGRDQCRAGSHIGFTVHGLWPQYSRGYPSDCEGSTRSPPRDALAATDGVYPDEGLARYEWRKHGTCSGLNPSAYFAAAKAARDAVTIPDKFKDVRAPLHLSPLDLEHAFTEANPRLRPGMLAAVCRSGTLDEIRICFTKDLKGFQLCPEVVRQRCRSRDMTVPPLR